ncbi:MAG: hypothetical protein JSW40_05275, partial [Candidatus Omnitrophota bacterium]
HSKNHHILIMFLCYLFNGAIIILLSQVDQAFLAYHILCAEFIIRLCAKNVSYPSIEFARF